MNKITMTLQVDHLILEALKEDGMTVAAVFLLLYNFR